MPEDKDQQQTPIQPQPTPSREPIEVETSDNSRLNKGNENDFQTKEEKKR